MKHTLTEHEQTLIQGGCIEPDTNTGLPGDTIYDPRQELPWPPYVINLREHLIIH